MAQRWMEGRKTMREILFRGKRKDNGEWIEGYYNYATDGYNLELHLISDKITGIHTEVIPETVGQYTGMTDKNGKKIFEGDAVWFSEEKERGVVYFDNSCSRFAVRFDTFDAAFDHLYSNELEIIGNVHDNPELTEGGE